MIKSFEKILIVLLVISLAFGMICLNYSYATEATVSASSAKEGETYSVTVKMPSGAVACSGNITVTYNDGKTDTYTFAEANNNLEQLDDVKTEFTAKSGGTATITVSNLKISDKDTNKMNSNSTLTQSFNVEAKPQAPAEPTPTNTTAKPENTTNNKPENNTPSTPATNNSGSTNNNGSTNTQTPSTPATTPDTTYTKANETVYAKAKVNVRSGAGTTYGKLGSLDVGQDAKRTGVGSNGWSKISYKGKTGYVKSDYLTTRKSEVTAILDDLNKNNTANNVVSNNVVSNNVVKNTSKNTNVDVYNTIVDEIGVLPQVGRSSANAVYYISLIVAVFAVGYSYIRIHKNEEE